MNALPRIIALPLLAACLASTALPVRAETPLPVFETRVVETVIGIDSSAAQGAFRSRSQTIFSPHSQEPERRLYEVFDPHPTRDLDFTWAADDLAADRAGRITGSGRLVWRLKDSPTYDDAAIVSTFRGQMKGGKPHGTGLYADREGLIYDGQWRNGRPHGAGRLILPNGEEYAGSFRNGFAEGRGTFTETTWERFEGTFSRGLRDGTGKTTLPSGLAYESQWRAGRETPNSLRIRIAQVGAAPAIGGTDDVKMGITMRRNPGLPEGIRAADLVLYTAQTTPDGLTIQPSDKRLVDRWLNNAPLVDATMVSEISPVRHGLFGVSNGYVQPVAFNISFQNTGTQPVEVQRLDIQSETSRQERAPALDVKSGFCGECMVSYTPEFFLYNYGVADAEASTLRFSFETPGQRPAANAPQHRQVTGTLKTRTEISIQDALAREKVDVAKLEDMRGAGLQCPSKDARQCLREAQQNPIFGALRQKMTLKGNTLTVQLVGTLDYSYIDHAGAKQQKSVPISLPIGLANIYELAEAGSDGPPKALRANPLHLRTQAAPYTLPVPFRAAIAPGRTANFTLQLDAEASSWHDLRIAAHLSNGTVIRSPALKLLYFKPRPMLDY